MWVLRVRYGVVVVRVPQGAVGVTHTFFFFFFAFRADMIDGRGKKKSMTLMTTTLTSPAHFFLKHNHLLWIGGKDVERKGWE